MSKEIELDIAKEIGKNAQEIIKLIRIKMLSKELIDMITTSEISDNGNEFYPTTIGSCRVQHTMRLGEIIPELKELLKV